MYLVYFIRFEYYFTFVCLKGTSQKRELNKKTDKKISKQNTDPKKIANGLLRVWEYKPVIDRYNPHSITRTSNPAKKYPSVGFVLNGEGLDEKT